MKTENYINELLEIADSKMYSDFCRIMAVIWWNMYEE